MPTTRKRVAAFIHGHGPRLVRPVNGALLRLLTTGREICGGSLEAFLILGTFTQRMSEHPDFPTLDLAKLFSGEIYPLPTLPIGIQSIADSTGIPRESVRRRVNQLVQQGWVERGDDGRTLRMTLKGVVETNPIRERLIDLVTECVVSVNYLASRENGGRPPAA